MIISTRRYKLSCVIISQKILIKGFLNLHELNSKNSGKDLLHVEQRLILLKKYILISKT
jgi:hypothetical protein